jgi:oligopeptide transport system ATP-binding protein
MIFQDPMSSLNPIMRIGQQITESMIINGKRKKQKLKKLTHVARVRVSNLHLEIKHLHGEERKARMATFRQDLKEARIERAKVKKEARKTIKEEYDLIDQDFKARIQAAQADYKNATSEEKKIALKKLRDVKELYARQYKVTKKEAFERAVEIMREVGIPEPEKRFKQYPFQFSGGMRQRIVIAIALTANPDVLICDEPTTALDVTIQAQILELIKQLKKDRNLSVIFITHDLGVVANMADRVAVMYAGKIVEIGKSEEVFYEPKHPYTWALLSSMPDLDSKERLTAIPGTPPNMLFPPVGDAFADRNSFAMKIDFEKEPPLFKITDTHYAATWLLHPDAPKVELPAVIQNRIKRMHALTKEVKA